MQDTFVVVRIEI